MNRSYYPNMTIVSQQTRIIQPKIYEAIYTNISFLTKYYPTTKEFQQEFEINMFVKNNALAVIHVSYFLLNILDPIRLKETITVWPILQKSDEGRFRIDLLQYFNNLNDLYRLNLPSLAMSHLVTPKRYEFGVFMLKLSQWIVSRYLKKNKNLSEYFYERMKPTISNVDKYIGYITKIAEHIETINYKGLNNARIKNVELEKEDERISSQITVSKENISFKREELKKHKSDIIEIEDFDKSFIENEREHIGKMVGTSNKVDEIIRKLLSEDFIFDYKLDKGNSQQNVKLNDLLRNVNNVLKEKAFKMHGFLNQDFQQNIEKIQSINGIMKGLISSMNNHCKNLTELELAVGKMNEVQESLSLINVMESDYSSLGILNFNDD